MIKSEIKVVCDKCNQETYDVSDRIDKNPEWYVIGVSVHTLHEDDWDIDLSTGECLCPSCK